MRKDLGLAKFHFDRTCSKIALCNTCMFVYWGNGVVYLTTSTITAFHNIIYLHNVKVNDSSLENQTKLNTNNRNNEVYWYNFNY